MYMKYKYVEEVEGAEGLVTNYAFPKFSFQIGKMNQLGFSISYWDKDLDLEFLRWFLYINFSSKRWGVLEFIKHRAKEVEEYIGSKNSK